MTTGSDPLLDLVQDQSPEWTRYLAVDADLDIEVDTAAGEHATGRLTGHGHRLRLEFDRPELLAETTDRSTLTAVAAQLVRLSSAPSCTGPGPDRGRGSGPHEPGRCLAHRQPAHQHRPVGVGTRGPKGGLHDRRGRGVRVVRRVTALLAAAAIVRASVMVGQGVTPVTATLTTARSTPSTPPLRPEVERDGRLGVAV